MTLHPELCMLMSVDLFPNDLIHTRPNLQLGVLDSQATSSSATTVDKNPLVALTLTRERQTELLVERQAHGDKTNTSGGSLLRRKVVRDLVRGTLLDNSVLSEAAAVEVVGIGAVCDTGNSVADLVVLGDFRADLDDGAAEVAADGRACCGQVVDVLPVCRVECNGVHLDENAVLKKLRLGNTLDLGLAG